jgi:hypothetical protein
MYEAVTDTGDSSYLVNLDQVYDIVGEEDWIRGEVKCLANLASSWTITLSWGANKKESIKQRSVLSDEGLQIGDHVLLKIMVNNGHTKLKKMILTWKTIQPRLDGKRHKK